MLDKTGKYFVYLYGYYKSDWQCKGLFAGTPAEKLPNFSELCRMIGYKLRWYEVDTRAKRARVTMSMLLEVDGSLDPSSMRPNDSGWQPLPARAGKARFMADTLDKITARVVREVQKEKAAGRF